MLKQDASYLNGRTDSRITSSVAFCVTKPCSRVNANHSIFHRREDFTSYLALLFVFPLNYSTARKQNGVESSCHLSLRLKTKVAILFLDIFRDICSKITWEPKKGVVI
jgi:hypothetical protein